MRQEKGRRGIAMIVVLVMLILFSSLALAVVLTATLAIRRAYYYRDKTTAQQIAEAGLNDAIFWMNYAGYYDRTYPFDRQYFCGSDYAETDTPWLNEEIRFRPPGTPERGECVLQFFDSDTSDQDLLVSKGMFRGRNVSIQFNIRGNNGNGNNVHETNGRRLSDWNGYTVGTATWGVPDEMNKHVVFANRTATTGTPTVKGNLAYRDSTSTFPASGTDWTRTHLHYNVNADYMVRVDSSLFQPFGSYSVTYQDDHTQTYPFNYDPDGPGPAPQVSVTGVDTFRFDTGDTITTGIWVRGNATFYGTASIQDYVYADTDITISSNSVTISNNATAYARRNFTVSAANTTAYVGSICAAGQITLPSGARVGTAAEPGKIVAWGIGSSVTLNGITMYGTVYSNGGSFTFSGTNTVYADPATGIAIAVDRRTVGAGSFTLTLPSNTSVQGTILTRGVDVTLSGATVTGEIVSSQTVTLASGTLNWDRDAVSRSGMPAACRGGIRRYLPVRGSWRITW